MGTTFAPVDAVRLFFNPNSLEVHTIEYEDDDDFAHLPSLFVKRFYDYLPENVVFTDPVGNQFYLFVVKHKREMIVGGWLHVAHFYGLPLGGYIRMIYIGNGHFFIQVFNDDGNEVVYPPLPEPVPITATTDDGIIDAADDPMLVDAKDYHIMYMHTITNDDMTKNVLTLPYDFCWRAVGNKSIEIKLVEAKGDRKWNCFMNMETGSRQVSAVTGEWAHFRNHKRLKVGDKILLGAQKIKPSHLYYVKKF